MVEKINIKVDSCRLFYPTMLLLYHVLLFQGFEFLFFNMLAVFYLYAEFCFESLVVLSASMT